MSQFTIIDAHAHIFPAKIAQKATQNIGAFYDIPMCHTGAADVLLQKGERIGVTRYLVCSTATRPAQVESINSFIHDQCAEHPEFFGFATLHPAYNRIEEELDRVQEMGLHGIKLHPDFQSFDIDSAEAMAMYRHIGARGLPILFHTGDNRYDYSAPRRLRRVAEAFPDLVCIGAHFGGYQAWHESMQSLRSCPNVFFDTSSTLAFVSPDEATDMLHYFGVHRFLWGSDFPMWDHQEEYHRFMALPLTDPERERIFSGTFRQLFGAS